MIEHLTLEANIVRHCNNRCAGCNHGAPFSKAYMMQAEVLARDLAALKPIFHAGEMWLLGGEPLLHPNLVELLDVTRSSGMADRVGVLTNGRLLDRMPETFWQKLDILKISVYPTLDAQQLKLAREMAACHGFSLLIYPFSSFYKLFAPHPNGETFYQCPWKSQCWTIHEGCFYLCPEAGFWPEQFMGMEKSQDGLALDGTLTEARLMEYINRKTPFAACRICDSYREQIPWHECASREQWLKDSTIKQRQYKAVWESTVHCLQTIKKTALNFRG